MDQLIGAIGRERFTEDNKLYNKLQDMPREEEKNLPPH
jgi:hypothetical protein